MLDTVIPLGFLGLFACFLVFWVVMVVRILRQRRVLKYTDAVRATELTGRVRQLKVRGYEEQAVRLVQEELAMPPKVARSWVKSI
ncbi:MULTISPECIES: hypothetical protein [unclassified Nonomuraea]|uniref:hypothetical protein n=1 Tax=unclassified Nonomuraea TaxID=2593643 RepID=UPI0033C4CEE0